jgi:hypothetical protein
MIKLYTASNRALQTGINKNKLSSRGKKLVYLPFEGNYFLASTSLTDS